MDFRQFNLAESLINALDVAGFATCTRVQEQVLPLAINGSDLYVQSQTGTGKTLAYLLPIVQQMLCQKSQLSKQALILVPTRELAVQVEKEATKIIQGSSLTAYSFYGGIGYDKQIAYLKTGVNIIVGTPGRIIDLEESGIMDLSHISYLVIDEADRMFDMGFYPDLRTLLKTLPDSTKRQTMLFSATLNSYIKNLAWEYTRNACEITIEEQGVTAIDVEQHLIHVSSTDKNKLLLGLLKKFAPATVIIFCNTKRMCEILCKRLRLNNIRCDYISGDLTQTRRMMVLKQFRQGKLQCLVATDVAARGLDIIDLEMVINYDLPQEAENYVHRIGRTARAGKKGVAWTICSEQDVYDLVPIERYIEKSIPAQTADPAMFVEDKSAKLFIKTQNDITKHRDKIIQKVQKRQPRGLGRYSRKNEAKQKEYRRDRRVKAVAENVDITSMTFQERMQYYKEKYAKNMTKTSIDIISKSSTKYNKKPRKLYKRQDKSLLTSKQVLAEIKTKDNQSLVVKPSGFIGKIKQFFGKKKGRN